MNKKKLKIMSVAMGATVAGLALTSQFVHAADIGAGCRKKADIFLVPHVDKDALFEDCGASDIANIEGRAGAPGDYEVAIGPDGAQITLTDKLHLDWSLDPNTGEGKIFSWILDWNAVTDTATFTVTDPVDNSIDSMSYTFDGPMDAFNAFGIQAKALDPDPKLIEGTEVSLKIDEVTIQTRPKNPNNGKNITYTKSFSDTELLVSAVSSATEPDFETKFYSLNPNFDIDLTQPDNQRAGRNAQFTSISGTFQIDFDDEDYNPQDLSARSRIGFSLLLFDPPIAVNGETVPEPNSIIGLLTVGALGATSMLKHKRTNRGKID